MSESKRTAIVMTSDATGAVSVVLYEDGQTVETVFVDSQQTAEGVAARWVAGQYVLLREAKHQ